MASNIEALEKAVESNPGADEFAELAQLLSEDKSRRVEAREICFRGLSANRKHKLGRLVLAHLFYLDEMFEFAAREIAELVGTPNAPSLDKLIGEFSPLIKQTSPVAKPGPAADAEAEEAVVAEFDIDSEFLEAIDELKDGK